MSQKAMNVYNKVRFKQMRKLVGDAREKILLDVGAGVIAISSGIKTKKTIRLDGEKKRKPDVCCNVNREPLPFKEGAIDIILAGEVIEHLFNPFKFLKECNRVLKKNGSLILSTPNICSLKNRFFVMFNKMPQHCAIPFAEIYGGISNMQSHVCDFNLPHLSYLLKKAGFGIVKKTSNGVIFKNKTILSPGLCPPSFGEILVVKCVKK